MEEKITPEVQANQPVDVKAEEVKDESGKINTLLQANLHYTTVINNQIYTFITPYNFDIVAAKQAAYSFLGQLDLIKDHNEKKLKEKEEDTKSEEKVA